MSFIKGHKLIEFSVQNPEGTYTQDLTLQRNLISYYENVTDGSIHMEVGIQDAIGFLDAVPIRSGCLANIVLEHPTGVIRYEDDNALVITNIVGATAEMKRQFYTLILESKPTVNNHVTRVYKKYTGPISQSVVQILTEDLGISAEDINADLSANTYPFMGNYKKPLHTCSWLAAKARPQKSGNSTVSGTAGFLFWESLGNKYNFRSIDSLFADSDNAPVYTYSEVSKFADPNNSFRILEIPKWSGSFDILDKLREGQYKSSNIFFDIVTRQPYFYEFSYKESEGVIDTANQDTSIPQEIDTYFSRMMLSVLDRGTMSSEGDLVDEWQDQPKFQAQATSRYASMFSQTLDIVVPMNISLGAGQIIRCDIPKLNTQTPTDSFVPSPSSGYYMIKSLSHKFGSNRDVTQLKLVRDSFTKV